MGSSAIPPKTEAEFPFVPTEENTPQLEEYIQERYKSLPLTPVPSKNPHTVGKSTTKIKHGGGGAAGCLL